MNQRVEKEWEKRTRERRLPADLSGASLRGASLRRVNLAEAVLDNAVLRESDLKGANFRKAGLNCADLSRADLEGANLGMAALRFACLERANLSRVNLHQADMLGANLAGARLENADLTGAILPDGTYFTDEADLERFTHEGNAAFQSTLEAIAATGREYITAKGRNNEGRVGGQSWAEFIDRTYGSLADDPIEWHPPPSIASEDGRE